MRTRYTRRLLFCLVWVALPCAAQKISAQQWRSDLAFLSEKLTRLHMNPFAHISAEDFSSAVGALDSAIPGLSDAQIRAGMARLVALVQDSHTSIWIDSASRSFPFKVSRFENGWFLTGINAINQDKLGY